MAAERELAEETGYHAGTLRHLGGFWTSPGFCDEYIDAYLAQDLDSVEAEPDPEESIEIERVPLPQIADLIRTRRMKDAKTLAALHLARDLLSA